MPTDSLFNPVTAKRIEVFIRRPGHALLLSGPAGSGKGYTARLLAAGLLGTNTVNLDSQPYFYVISKEDDKSEISIDAARRLIGQMSLTVPAEAGRPVKRVALIEDAGRLSREAQNALLKLLEEPPAGSLIILTAGGETDILPTICSRTQKINILPVPLSICLTFFGRRYEPADIESQWRLSQGAVGLLNGLLEHNQSHPLTKAVAQAKHFLAVGTYERLTFCQSIAKNKAELAIFLEALAKVLGALQAAAAKKNTGGSKLLKARRLVSRLHAKLDNSANSRLLALELATGMPL